MKSYFILLNITIKLGLSNCKKPVQSNIIIQGVISPILMHS